MPVDDPSGAQRLALEGPALRATILTLGGVIERLEVPDRAGRLANVALGLRRPADYAAQGPYFGALIGRYANRIAGGRFTLDGREHRLATNDGPNSLHGGARGFDKRLWRVEAADSGRLDLSLHSPDGEEGYPGALRVRVTYAVEGSGTLRIDYAAETDAPTVLNLTNHSYWNLAGEGSGTVLDHELEIAADRFTPVDATLIPTGEQRAVEGTPFDFRAPRPIGARIRDDDPQLRIGRGYDHNWVLNGGAEPAARLRDPGSGRVLEVLTDQPGLQFYSGNLLDGTLVGPSGRAYRSGDGVALETQHFPDSPNRPDFPGTVLRPGEVFRSTTRLRFGAG
ncbi:galactose mutarotase [Roseomonas nepalensis]|uniref:Aldose 1-epimerase n=1 Tax=Muricoccus nepalensis TaxID=1854500 RepID=A0A502FSK0_9PROT|nr:aldose epimerase family protein [Roseomonas nepalensis]TPG52370.1 galactose mutarotase [Roseomonas nepalensis]